MACSFTRMRSRLDFRLIWNLPWRVLLQIKVKPRKVKVSLRSRLPEHHLNKDSENVVRMGVGLIATMSALVLGLLIASAKSTYDTKANEVNQITADIVMIDQFARRIRTRG
jgi:hypothetical protein